VKAVAQVKQSQRPIDDANAARVFRSIVADTGYPCLGARSVFNQRRATVRGYPRLGTVESARQLLPDLLRFSRSIDLTEGFASFVAVFRPDGCTDEMAFERRLWRQLEAIHELDTEPWDGSVSDDPADPHFAFSAGGTAYFVIGLHPGASRPARRAPQSILVFNPHQQFECLRASGRFDRMRDTIRRRDLAANGSINPMVADHGHISEACQYSGRRVDDGWRPSFNDHLRRADDMTGVGLPGRVSPQPARRRDPAW
jgi:FPC/CPF motif-containing protein YcgG